jgi:protein-disulfide isomerase
MASETDKLKSTNRILIAALIISSFFLGSLTNRIATLENNGLSDSANARETATTPTDVPSQLQKAKPKSVTDSDHIRGNKNAKITLLVYFDLECPFCQKFHSVTQELLKTYGDKIRLTYRHYPLPFHENAQKEAEASECIAEFGGNDAFWKYTDAIFERTASNGTGFALDKLGPLAAGLGVNRETFQTCLDSGKYENLVKGQIEDGIAAGVNGTPSTFIINSKGETQIVVGAQPIDVFKTEIDKALK